jgi:hypothetical protein
VVVVVLTEGGNRRGGLVVIKGALVKMEMMQRFYGNSDDV